MARRFLRYGRDRLLYHRSRASHSRRAKPESDLAVDGDGLRTVSLRFLVVAVFRSSVNCPLTIMIVASYKSITK